MTSPFYQPGRQSFNSSQSVQQPQGGFGVQTVGTFGGFQAQPNFSGSIFGGQISGGMSQQGGNPMFGGIGGLGFNPMAGSQFGMPTGGFNPYQQQQFNPYQQQQFNPYQQQQQFNPYQQQQQFNPYQQQQQFNPYQQQQQFNPYQQQQQFNPYQQQFNPYQQQQQQFNPYQQQQQYGPEVSRQAELQQALARQQAGLVGQQPQSPFTGPQRSAQDILSMAVGKTPQDMQYDLNKDGKITSTDVLAYNRQYGQQQPQTPQTPVDSGMNRGVDNMSVGPGFGSRQPMYGGLGSLGFNPMMGPQFGMPMQGFDPYQTQMMNRKQQFDQQQFSADQMPVMGDMVYRGGPEMSRLSELQRGVSRQQERVVGTRDMPLTADQKYQQAQQFGNQAYLYANSPAGRAAAAHFAMG